MHPLLLDSVRRADDKLVVLCLLLAVPPLLLLLVCVTVGAGCSRFVAMLNLFTVTPASQLKLKDLSNFPSQHTVPTVYQRRQT